MNAVWFRVALWFRRRVGTLVLLAALVAAVGAPLFVASAGAHRTATAPDRYTAAHSRGVDAIVRQDEGAAREAELRALRGVRRVDSMSFMFGGLADPSTGELVDAIVFAGSPRAINGRVVEGREPSAADEFIATRELVAETGATVGDRMVLFALTQDEVAEHGFDPSYADPIIEGALVGVIESASSLDDPTAVALFPRALLDSADVGLSGSAMAVDLAEGVTLSDLRIEVTALPRPEELLVEAVEVVSADTRTAVSAQSTGLWVLAALGTGAAVAAVGQLLSRTARLDPDERAILLALGCTRRSLVAETVARTAPAVFVGTAVGLMGAIAASAAFPFGFVRRLEASPGVRVDVVPLLAAWVAFTVGLLVWVAVATSVRARSQRPPRPGVVDRLAERCSAAMTGGMRIVFDARRGGTTAIALGTGAVLIAALAAASTFAASTRAMVRDPARYGVTADVFHDDGADEVEPELIDAFATDPDVDGVTLYRTTRADIGDVAVALIGMQPVRGDVLPLVVAGRLPADADEIAVGNRTAADVGVAVGDTLTVGSSGQPTSYDVVGTVLPPNVRGNDVIGEGLVVTWAGFDRIDPDLPVQAAALDLAPDDRAEQVRVVTGLGLDPLAAGTPSPPGAINNVARITFVPFVLAALLGLLVFVVVLNFTFTSVRRSDRDVGILRSLGADGRWLGRAMAWAGVCTAAVPLLVGVPIGILAGRLAYSAFADHLWITPVIEIPGVEMMTFASFVVLSSVSVALLSGRRARRAHAGNLLRSVEARPAQAWGSARR